MGPLPSVDYHTSFFWFKMSGFGGAETGEDIDANSRWSSSEGEQFFPRFVQIFKRPRPYLG